MRFHEFFKKCLKSRWKCLFRLEVNSVDRGLDSTKELKFDLDMPELATVEVFAKLHQSPIKISV